MSAGWCLPPLAPPCAPQILTCGEISRAPRAPCVAPRVRVHLGAAEFLGRLRVLSYAGRLRRARGLCEFAWNRRSSALPTERFIIRSYSPSRTVAGGRVLDPAALKHRGREAGLQHARLATLLEADEAAQFAYFVETGGERGVRSADLAARTGWRDQLLERSAGKPSSRRWLTWTALIARSSLTAWPGWRSVSRRFPQAEPSRGVSRETLRERLRTRRARLFRAVISHLEKGRAYSRGYSSRGLAQSLALFSRPECAIS